MSSFFSVGSLGTLGGVVIATVMITNGIQYVTGRSPRWLGLLIAQGLCAIGATTVESELKLPWLVIVTIMNGFFAFSCATGAAQMTHRAFRRSDGVPGREGDLGGETESGASEAGCFLSGEVREGSGGRNDYWAEGEVDRRFWSRWF